VIDRNVSLSPTEPSRHCLILLPLMPYSY